VFMDVDSLSLGRDFVEHVERALASAGVALILIGPGWLTAVGKTGGRRLDDPDDYVRREVATALRSSTLVIPVFVDGADMPESDELPEDLQSLTRRQGFSFERRGRAGIDQILRAIEQVDPPTHAVEDFRTAALGFDDGDVKQREAAARQIRRVAPLLTLDQVLDFSRSEAVGERIGAAIALGAHLKDPNDARRDQRVEVALGALLRDPASSLIRYRAAQTLRNSPAFVPSYEFDLQTRAESDENRYVRDMATQALRAAGK